MPSNTTAIFAGILIATNLLFPAVAIAQEEVPEGADPDLVPIEQYALAEVVEIISEDRFEGGGIIQYSQVIKLKILSGAEKGRELELDTGSLFVRTEDQRVRAGERVVLGKTTTAVGETYFIADKFRLPSMAWIAAGFFLLVIIFGRLRGFTSILGMILSILVLALFTVPRILAGDNPLLISLISAFGIALLSLYLAHGLNKRTTIALLGTLVTLSFSIGLASLFVRLSKLFGTGSEEAFYLQVLQQNTINLRGLLLGGIVIGALGVLDDITTAQSATIDELHKTNPQLKFAQLYRKGISVGREHIASLVNTLVLAYAGASLPLLLLFTANNDLPVWVTLNSEFLAEEIIRTLVGSTALVFAVPVSTILAAYFYSAKFNSEPQNQQTIEANLPR